MDLLYAHFKLTFPSAAANPEATVQTRTARFTILAPRLIRMEWSPTSFFEDRASQASWFRKQAVPGFKVRRGQARMVIETSALRLSYEPGKPFIVDTLWVEVPSTGETWRFGDPDRTTSM
jgi:alpha-glucosidase